jgi:8-oxo-dGTP diphosphatase
MHRVVAAVLVQGGRFLLGRRSPEREFYPNVWDMFGGHIEEGEQPQQTLVRELQEELGVTPTQWMELETIRDSLPGQNDAPPQDLIAHFYCVAEWTGKPSNRQPEEHSVIQWFSYAEAVKLDLAHPTYPRLLARCLDRRAGSGA